ncbi:MAG TPA: hypothetical protein P5540_08010 [Candidatus Hydrogenedentes bacterium]|nr:hypothetical protein [Candidatus Hydrogenedentota bacterium]
MKRVFICSRFAGDVDRNIETARKLCRQAVERGHAPFAPHLLYPQFMDDTKPKEREVGIACGLEFMTVCDEVWAYVGDGVSDGMRREIAQAQRLGKVVAELTEI